MCYRYQQHNLCVTDIKNNVLQISITKYVLQISATKYLLQSSATQYVLQIKVCITEFSNKVHVTDRAKKQNTATSLTLWNDRGVTDTSTYQYTAHAKETLNSMYNFTQKHENRIHSRKKSYKKVLTIAYFTVGSQINHSKGTHHLSYWWKYIKHHFLWAA